MNQNSSLNKYAFILFLLITLSGLYLTSRYSFLLFHTLAESFSIIIACGIFMVAWNSRQFLENNYLLFLGIAYLFIAGIDILHTLSYKGMNIINVDGANLPTQFWIAARYVQGISFLIAPFFFERKFKPEIVMVIYSLVFALLTGSILYWKIFPDCYIEGIGLTAFKKVSEYIISVILCLSIYLLYKKQEKLNLHIYRMIIVSILLTVASEIAFTFYISVYGFSNLLGHFLKVASFYLIYKATIQTGLSEPYNLLFKELKQRETALQELSIKDELTGLYNRRGFAILSEQQLETAKRINKSIRLFFADLDWLKYINDKFGHLEGDRALISAACILRSTFRSQDVISRIGGDEFAMVTIEDRDIDAEIILDRLRKITDTFNADNHRPYEISFSTGVVGYNFDYQTDINELLSKADNLMYREKQKKKMNNYE